MVAKAGHHDNTMQLELTFSPVLNGVERRDVVVCVRNTTRQDIRRQAALARFPFVDRDDPAYNAQVSWLYANSFVTAISGLDWQPSAGLTADELQANYEQFLDAVPAEIADAIFGRIWQLKYPPADVLEKPDNRLTPDEAADPN